MSSTIPKTSTFAHVYYIACKYFHIYHLDQFAILLYCVVQDRTFEELEYCQEVLQHEIIQNLRKTRRLSGTTCWDNVTLTFDLPE